MPTPAEGRFTGCLIGQCVGDAVGFMVEGYPGSLCATYAHSVLNRGEGDLYLRGPFRLGQYSDDSQLARALMESLVDKGGFDPADYALRIARLFADQRIVGGGWATSEAAARLAAGVPWQEAGTPAPNAGNGSAMRAAPIGLMFYDDPDALVRAAVDQGRCTHADPRCSAGAVAIAGAVALALTLPTMAPEAFATRLADLTAGIDDSVSRALAALPPVLALAPKEALPWLLDLGNPDVRDVEDGISPFVTTSVLWSLYAFLRSPEHYSQALITAIAGGGDVDTTAAMTGAIAGARLGLAAVPQDLVNRLTDRGTWRASQLTDLAARLWRMKTQN
jgi:ADP-ribosylglycohydrolase